MLWMRELCLENVNKKEPSQGHQEFQDQAMSVGCQPLDHSECQFSGFPVAFKGESLIQTINMGVVIDLLTESIKIKAEHSRFEYVIYSVMRYPPEKST